MQEGKTQTAWAGFGDLPKLDPIIAHEVTDDGWRGLTEHGEIIEVHSRNGHKAEVPDSDIVVMRGGKAIGQRAIEQRGVNIQDYLDTYNRASLLFRSNQTAAALDAVDAALKLAPTLHARFNRSFMLLTLGRWQEGLAEYEDCEQHPPFLRPQVRAALEEGLQPWRGEDIRGKRLLLIHAHGLGDTVMCLRYVPVLQEDMGATVLMMLPPELTRLGAQLGTVTANSLKVIEADYFCSFLSLLHLLKQTPENVQGGQYLFASATLRQRWKHRLSYSERRRIGIAWDVGVRYDDDYPRAIPLKMLDVLLPQNVDLFSLQVQGGEEAQERGINIFPFEDLADCAAFMTEMDEIISVDTAALHLAGAIGHPRVHGLLSHWHSWRWLAPWYPNVKLYRQTTAGDWPSAIAQIEYEP